MKFKIDWKLDLAVSDGTYWHYRIITAADRIRKARRHAQEYFKMTCLKKNGIVNLWKWMDSKEEDLPGWPHDRLEFYSASGLADSRGEGF